MGIMRKRLGWVLAPMLALGVASLHASDDRTTAKAAASSDSTGKTASGAPRPAGAGGARVAGASFGTRATTILGSAWNADNTPIIGAHLRLRNVVTGKLEAMTKANETGQFTFENVEGGSYVVELVSESGHVQTVGHVFTIAPGETVATFVRLGPKVPWATAVFNNTAGNVASTAATEGIAAIRPAGNCQSPPCH
jgi:hypothetical protein